MADKFTERAQAALNKALSAAAELGHTYIGTEHLLIGLTEESCAASKILSSHSITSEDIIEAVTEYAGAGLPSDPRPKDMTPRARRVLESAQHAAKQTPVGYIGTEHLLYAILEDKDAVAYKLLASLDVNITDIKSEILSILSGGKRTEGKNKNSRTNEEKIPSAYGRDLTECARRGTLDPVLARDAETERLIHILCRRTKNNPCLIGEPGVGKTAVVEGLAQRIAAGDVPEMLREKSIFSLDLSSMIAGAKYRGEFEERLKGVMETIMHDPSLILFIDELHTIVGAGAAEGAVDAANILKPLLARGEIRIIGATTHREYRRYIERDAALERRFQPLIVEEPSIESSMQILLGLKDKYEKHHKVKIPKETLDSAVRLSVQYITDRNLPDKAIDLIDEAAARVSLRATNTRPNANVMESKLAELTAELEEAIILRHFERAVALRDAMERLREEMRATPAAEELPTVGESDIADVITSWTGIPAGKLTLDEEERMTNLAHALSERIIGQNEAISTITNAIRRARTGVGDPERPIGSFLFVGPTGVGKTELSRVLAEELYGRADALIRLDMSEYKESISSSKLIGSPPGYVGYDEGGQLTEQIRRHPYSIVLFDEIEKAHEDVYHLLLQILDDGVLTDSQGRKVSFKNTVIILTSNLGAERLTGRHTAGFRTDDTQSMQAAEKELLGDVRNFFRAEFINRLDEIIIFHPLDSVARDRIARLLAGETTARLKKLDIALHISDDAIRCILDTGYDPALGARPLKRAVTRLLETPLSDMMIRRELMAGDLVEANASDTEHTLTFSVRRKSPTC